MKAEDLIGKRVVISYHHIGNFLEIGRIEKITNKNIIVDQQIGRQYCFSVRLIEGNEKTIELIKKRISVIKNERKEIACLLQRLPEIKLTDFEKQT